MPSHKVLKSVVNSLVGSFVGLLNYWHDDYVMGHVVQAAWITGATDIDFDLLTGQAQPSALLVSSVAESLALLHQRFAGLVERSGSSMTLVSDARLRVSVDPSTKRPYRDPVFTESPFCCSATIVDDRGKVYEYELRDWWFPEHPIGEGFTAAELAACGA